MAQLKPTKTVFTVSQFLDWQRNKTLKLKPMFQRREVWSPQLKSLLIDTVVSGLPMPIIFLRQLQDLDTLKNTLEVVDGQQRLRTLLTYIDPASLPDYDPAKDDFSVRKIHNSDIAGVSFQRLPSTTKAAILDYEMSTHVFPSSTGDDDVLRIFARLNSTGAKLKPQEIRNASFYGEFKTLVYELAFANLPLWRRWRLFTDQDIARMQEVESVSDYVLVILQGIQSKSDKKLTDAYKQYDEALPGSAKVESRFQRVMDAIDDSVGDILGTTSFRRQALFYSLFTVCYDHMYDLRKSYLKPHRAVPLPADLHARLMRLNDKIVNRTLPPTIQEAMDRATAHASTRKARHDFFKKDLKLG